MLFDAGQWGWVEVDAMEREQGRLVGIKNPGDPFSRERYVNYGADGCVRIRTIPPEEAKRETENQISVD